MLLSCHPDKSKFSWQRNNHERKKSIQKITRDKKGGEKWNAKLSPEEIEKRRIITMVQWIMIIVTVMMMVVVVLVSFGKNLQKLEEKGRAGRKLRSKWALLSAALQHDLTAATCSFLMPVMRVMMVMMTTMMVTGETICYSSLTWTVFFCHVVDVGALFHDLRVKDIARQRAFPASQPRKWHWNSEYASSCQKPL